MLNFFHRQVQLWGEETQFSLQEKRIIIIGCGGLGSSLAYALGASGIGTIHLVDFDEVSIHNIHRQIAFRLDDQGKSKAQIVANTIKTRSPYVQVIAHQERFDTFALKNIEADLIIDATDNLPTRAAIDAYAKAHKTPWIYGSVEAFNGQVAFFDQASFDLFKITNRTPAGIAAPIVMHIASLQANLALRYLAGLSVKKDWLYYLYFDEAGELITQKFALPAA
ncbi:MAG: thiamine biosynthesis protein ThiF [Sulfuricurvum sp. PC08-66]|nr:MAG: thiamine biosynthesis protein ThiF [Sulfuricurvum sp. PC08-66]